jgi:hypothetical protein
LKGYSKYTVYGESLKYFLIWVITLTSLKFYTLFIPYGAGKVAVVISLIIVLIFFFIHLIYGRVEQFKKGFTIPILILFLGLLISSVAGAYFHDQNTLTSLLTQNEFYLFMFYFLLHQLKPDPAKLLKMFMVLAYVYCFIYFVQYMIFPKIILSTSVFMDRGTIRIFMPGAAFLFTAYFLCLMRFYIYKKIKYLLYIIPMLIIVLLLGTRQILASIALLTMLSILLSRAIKSKAVMVFVIVLCMIPFYFLFQGIFLQMFEVTQKESSSMEDNIRYRAAYYFLVEFNNNKTWMLTGNGMPNVKSDYGRFIETLSANLGYYQGDIGIIGDFVKFGIFFVIGNLLIYFKLIVSKTAEQYRFILFNVLSMVMTMFTGGGIDANTIIMLSMMMYIVDVNKAYLPLNSNSS